MSYALPKSVVIGGRVFPIRYDYRVILDIFEAMNDPELTDQERALAVLQMFYMDFDAIEDYEAAIRECFWFINGGKYEESSRKKPRLVAWGQDFPYIAAPINRVLGYEIRAVEYDPETNTGGLHWWTFLSAYMEIGDCLFAQVVGIRSKKARGQKLDASEREFYRRNRDLVDIKARYTEAEEDLLKQWTGIQPGCPTREEAEENIF